MDALAYTRTQPPCVMIGGEYYQKFESNFLYLSNNTKQCKETIMTQKVYISTPTLKVGESSIEHGGNAYIYFDEYTNVPGLENADIRIEFDRNNSFQEIVDLVAKLKSSGFKFVVQK